MNDLFKKQIEDTDLFKKYTLQGVLDQLDFIECFESPRKNAYWRGSQQTKGNL